MKLGKLNFNPIEDNLNLVAQPVKEAIEAHKLPDVFVAEIDPELADTATFCEHYRIGLEVSANCVIVEAKRADKTWYAACMILATSRADVNGVIRKQLDARKVSFAPMDKATTLSSMEYGGITPVGLPADWPILIDDAVAASENVVIGSGIRGSKLLVPSRLWGGLPNAKVMHIAKDS
jgi:prolyl-tRNA editing enzyme YbaK/EbsC (Cys-tRNA(Pro) deacylase)